jgi:hypothetical protein
MNIIQGYSSDTEILTNEGFKFFEELNGKERIITKNDDNILVYVDLIKVLNQNIEGHLLNFRCTQTDLLVSPDTKMWVQKSYLGNVNEWDFINANEMNKSYYTMDRGGIWNHKDKQNTIYFPEYTSKAVNKNHGSQPEQIFDSKWFFKFLGLWISKGCLHTNKKSIYPRNILLRTNNMKKKINVMEILDNLNLKYNFYNATNEFQINNIPLYTFLYENFYQNITTNKRKEVGIPTWIKSSSIENLEYLIQGIFMNVRTSDRKNCITRVFASDKLRHDIIELSLKINVGSSINFLKKAMMYTYMNNKRTMTNDVYGISFGKENKFLIRKNENVKMGNLEYYSGNIFNVVLPNHHKIFIMRKGMPCWSGSCQI